MDVSQKQKDFWGIAGVVFAEIFILAYAVFEFMQKDYFSAFFFCGIMLFLQGRRLPQMVKRYRTENADAQMREAPVVSLSYVIVHIFFVVFYAACAIKIKNSIWMRSVCILMDVWMVIEIPKLLRGYKRYRYYHEFGK